MALWDVLVTTHDEAGKRVSEVLGSYGPKELGEAVVEACRRADEIGGGIQVGLHTALTGRTHPSEQARVAWAGAPACPRQPPLESPAAGCGPWWFVAE